MTHFLLRGLTWSVLREWTQNHPQVVGICPGHHPQLIGQNRVFKLERPGPAPLTTQVISRGLTYITYDPIKVDKNSKQMFRTRVMLYR